MSFTKRPGFSRETLTDIDSVVNTNSNSISTAYVTLVDTSNDVATGLEITTESVDDTLGEVLTELKLMNELLKGILS